MGPLFDYKKSLNIRSTFKNPHISSSSKSLNYLIQVIPSSSRSTTPSPNHSNSLSHPRLQQIKQERSEKQQMRRSGSSSLKVRKASESLQRALSDDNQDRGGLEMERSLEVNRPRSQVHRHGESLEHSLLPSPTIFQSRTNSRRSHISQRSVEKRGNIFSLGNSQKSPSTSVARDESPIGSLSQAFNQLSASNLKSHNENQSSSTLKSSKNPTFTSNQAYSPSPSPFYSHSQRQKSDSISSLQPNFNTSPDLNKPRVQNGSQSRLGVGMLNGSNSTLSLSPGGLSNSSSSSESLSYYLMEEEEKEDNVRRIIKFGKEGKVGLGIEMGNEMEI